MYEWLTIQTFLQSDALRASRIMTGCRFGGETE